MGWKENWAEPPWLCWLFQQDFFFQRKQFIKKTRSHLFPPHSQRRVSLATKKHGGQNSAADTCCIFLSLYSVPALSSWRSSSSQRLRALSSTGWPHFSYRSGLSWPLWWVWVVCYHIPICILLLADAVDDIFCVCWSLFIFMVWPFTPFSCVYWSLLIFMACPSIPLACLEVGLGILLLACKGTCTLLSVCQWESIKYFKLPRDVTSSLIDRVLHTT